VDGNVRRLREDLELTAYRIVEEAIGNVVEHASATRVDIELLFRGCMVRITIKDNGVGYDTPHKAVDFARQGKLGLTEVREKAQSIGAIVTMQSQPGIGTRIDLIIPSLDIPVEKMAIKATTALSKKSLGLPVST